MSLMKFRQCDCNVGRLILAVTLIGREPSLDRGTPAKPPIRHNDSSRLPSSIYISRRGETCDSVIPTYLSWFASGGEMMKNSAKLDSNRLLVPYFSG